MLHIQIDENALRELYLSKVEERLSAIEDEVFFMSSAELCKFVGMSWVTVSKYLICDEEFPKLRNGNRWIFPKAEVTKYLHKYYEAVRNDTGDVKTFKRKGS